MLIKKFYNRELINFLYKSQKNPIFKIGTGGGLNLSCYMKEYDEEKDKIFKPLIDFNKNILIDNKLCNFYNNKFFIEHRDLIFSKNDVSPDIPFHQDSYMDTGDDCFTSIYYYHVDESILGGELLINSLNSKLNESLFNFLVHKPRAGDIVFFDGNLPHKLGRIYGHGLQGTITIHSKINKL